MAKSRPDSGSVHDDMITAENDKVDGLDALPTLQESVAKRAKDGTALFFMFQRVASSLESRPSAIIR